MLLDVAPKFFNPANTLLRSHENIYRQVDSFIHQIFQNVLI